ncbi:hypothetical protein HB816_13790 [Listeria booriae]|uniref:hypothetical protein n=1 Tax=Listeria booriae TaxID=1552123 RepID=UPI0016281346|nr:hypothetical protein [Listeria booriae]MBC1231522.1 hypothetical protein [Listeria booriae]
MISEVLEEAEVKICNIVREKLHNKKIPFVEINNFVQETAKLVETMTGLGVKWSTEDHEFGTNRLSLYICDIDYVDEFIDEWIDHQVCTYEIKYDDKQNLFIATEVL